MQIYNHYFYFKEALTPEQCKNIINLGTSKIKKIKDSGESVAAKTAGNNHKQAFGDNSLPLGDKDYEQVKKELGKDVVSKTYVRDSEIAWLNEKWLYDLITPFILKANSMAGWNYDIDCGEEFQFTVYNKDGFYGWHSDGGMCNFSKYKRIIPGITTKNDKGNYPTEYVYNNSYVGKVRKLSATINLNLPGEYEGGNLKFDYGTHAQGERYHECVEIRPQGSIVIFPSFIYHQVTPITSGTRYSLVLWSLGKPFR